MDNVNPQVASPLFRLPGEVRNQIYHVLLFSPCTIPIRYFKHGTPSLDEPNTLPRTILPLFLSCRRLSLETQTFFYSRNAFGVAPASSWPRAWEGLPTVSRCFVDRLAPRNVLALRQVRVHLPPALREPGTFIKSGGPGELLPGLAGRCASVEEVAFEARSARLFRLRIAWASPTARRTILSGVADALREEFPCLREIVLECFARGNAESEWWEFGAEWVVGEGVPPVEQMRECGWMVRPVPYPVREPWPICAAPRCHSIPGHHRNSPSKADCPAFWIVTRKNHVLSRSQLGREEGGG